MINNIQHQKTITTILWVMLLCLLVGCSDPTGYVAFQPNGIPISISVNTTGEISFSIQREVTYPTPLGTFTVGVIVDPASYFGVSNALIIRVDGQEDRIYDLHGNDFNITFESGYYKQIILYKQGQNLYLEIARIETTFEPTRVIPQNALPGIYPIQREFPRDNQWIKILTEIEVLSNGQFIINVTFYNNDTKINELVCYEENTYQPYLLLPDGTRIFLLEEFCTSHRGESWQLVPGETFHDWAKFPPLQDATVPFTVHWSDNIGDVTDIVLIK